MVDNEYSPENYKTLKISNRAIIKYPETQRFIPDYLKAKKIYKNALKNSAFVIRCVPD